MVNREQVEDSLFIHNIAQYQSLQKIRAEKTKERDGKKKEKTDLKEKIDAYRLARKKDPKSVHNQLERGAKGLGLDRGRAFGGKYDGKVVRKVMEAPDEIYNGYRAVLKMEENRRPAVTNKYIDDLCDSAIVLMKSCNEVFSLLQKEKPTDDEQKRAREVADTAVSNHFALLNNKTPKVHVARDHAVDQYERLAPGFLRLLIEHWVELNHQQGYRIEQQFKHVPGNKAKAEFTAQSRHSANNAAIHQRKEFVKKYNARGGYKKRKECFTFLVSPSPPAKRQRPVGGNNITPQRNR